MFRDRVRVKIAYEPYLICERTRREKKNPCIMHAHV